MKYFSMFSGIGGFELGIQRAFDSRPDLRNRSEGLPEDSTNTEEPQVRADCIGYSEIDKYAIKVYERNFNGHTNYGDATAINATELPDFDLLVGGFPCQAFSVAGKRAGFNDTRGTLFFDIARILKEKQPRHLVLENVKGLLSHDSGRTFSTIIGVLTDLGYFVEWQVLNSKDFGVPQNRERVFIVGHLRGTPRPEVFPIGGADIEDTRIVGQDVAYTIDANYAKGTNTLSKGRRSVVAEIVQLNQPTHSNDRVYASDGISPTLNTMQGGNRQPFIAEDVKIRRLTPIECERLQGFPDNWTKYGIGDEPISDTQRYKMCGNGVTVNVVQAVIERLLATQVTSLASEHKTERSDRELAPSNSKSEDTLGIVSTGALPECECCGRQLLTGGKLCVKCKAYLGQSEPPQYTSLTEITAEYFMATDPDRVALQRKVLAWHKAEIAKLFEQIRSEAVRMNIPWGDGNGYDVVKAIDVEVLTKMEEL